MHNNKLPRILPFKDYNTENIFKTTASCQNVYSGICWQRRPRSACDSARSDQGLHCPQTESFETIEHINGEQMRGWDCACAVWCESAYFAHARRHFVAWFGPLTAASLWGMTLRIHIYSNIYKISPPKTENFQIKISDIFHISDQNIDCGYSLESPWRGGSKEYYNLCFWAEIRKIMYNPVNHSFTICGLRGSKLYSMLSWWVCNIGITSKVQKKKKNEMGCRLTEKALTAKK